MGFSWYFTHVFSVKRIRNEKRSNKETNILTEAFKSESKPENYALLCQLRPVSPYRINIIISCIIRYKIKGVRKETPTQFCPSVLSKINSNVRMNFPHPKQKIIA